MSVEEAGTGQGCPNGELPLCIISNIDLSEGGPRPSDQCRPLIVVTFSDSGQTSFTWTAPSGQLVDAVLVRSGASTNAYSYVPAVASDATPLVSPTGAQLTRITFCGELGATNTESDAGAPADAGPAPDAAAPPDDAGAGAGDDAAVEPDAAAVEPDGGASDASFEPSPSTPPSSSGS